MKTATQRKIPYYDASYAYLAKAKERFVFFVCVLVLCFGFVWCVVVVFLGFGFLGWFWVWFCWLLGVEGCVGCFRLGCVVLLGVYVVFLL